MHKKNKDLSFIRFYYNSKDGIEMKKRLLKEGQRILPSQFGWNKPENLNHVSHHMSWQQVNRFLGF